ncbi:hypothetical protein P154DRAFT_521218 [Amniculicola lignicola CBS 123094]|uniref:Mitochondrial import inner membrane translocase subunit TIM50 n=1 Tax=Amniculicola lignicola CBS 123094 TaxID=1392246 RepID=A0A6A5WJI5_9PLEO|nr:hypothetical protein P154DRAFT_521218 [Amniculicola lignicola CBS 123094]
MLPRAAFRGVLRARPARPALAVPHRALVASTSQWTRSYAHNNNNNNNNNRPPRNHTWKPSSNIKFSDRNSNQATPRDQPQFGAEATPERNNVPQSTGAGPGISQKSARPHAQQDYTGGEADFSGPKTPADNTAPATDAPQQPQKPLPDLRQGIPSTFGAEFGGEKEGRNTQDPNNITEDPTREPSAGGGGREGGELPKSAYETSTDRRRNRVANWGYLITLFAGSVGLGFLGRNWETEEEERAFPDAPNGWSPGAMYVRARARMSGQIGYYTEPSFPKLLPEVDPAPPLTLVLSLEDLLVHSEWSRQHGWRTAKRPGVDYFIRYLSQYYELVIFTSLRSMDADPVIRKLDPFRIVMWPLFREATRYEKGEYIKDLSYLNRDLSKVIVVDTDPSHVKLQPENAIILPKWKGEPGDKGLVALIPFLEYLAMGTVPDVRTALKSFEGQDIPTEFARREAKMREQFNKDLAAEKAKKGRGSAGNWVMNALGIKGQPGGLTLGDGQSLAEGFEQGKMLSDLFRERGQKQYETMEKEIRENGEKWLKEMADEEKKFQEEQMKAMKGGVFSFLGAPGEKK